MPLRQEFFYHVLLTLDSHTFNSHVKAAIAEEIARLYNIPSTEDVKAAKQETTQGRSAIGSHEAARAGDGFEGFTERLVKLKVFPHYILAKTQAQIVGLGLSFFQRIRPLSDKILKSVKTDSSGPSRAQSENCMGVNSGPVLDAVSSGLSHWISARNITSIVIPAPRPRP